MAKSLLTLRAVCLYFHLPKFGAGNIIFRAMLTRLLSVTENLNRMYKDTLKSLALSMAKSN